MKKICRKSITIWNLESITSFLIIGFLSSVVFYFFNEYKFITKLYFLTLIAITYFLLKDVILNPFSFKNTSYQLNAETLYIKKGGLTLSETTIPLKRIQHVDIEQSFYSRFFSLYQINFYTAGDSHSLEYLNEFEANQLKDKVVDFVANMGVDTDE